MMISPSPPHWLCSRRAFARISSIPTSLESSTHSGAAARRWLALRIFGQRCSATRPLRSSSPLIRAWDATKRWASSASAISSEKSATGLPCSTAAFSAMLHTSALFPIAGRAATMIRFPGWNPPVISSRSLNPEGVPVREVPSSDSRCSLSSSSCNTSSIARKSCWRSSRATSSIAFSACSTSSRGRALVAEHALLDLIGGLQQTPQQRVLAHDLRVAAGVSGGRHDAGQLVDGGRPPRCPRACRPGAGGR